MNLAVVYKKSVGFLNKLLLMFHDFARRFFDFTFFPFLSNTISHIIHGTGIFTSFTIKKSTIHVGKLYRSSHGSVMGFWNLFFAPQKNPPTSAFGAVWGKRQVDWMESCEGDVFFFPWFFHDGMLMA